jgi:hypothetical protein
MLQKKQMNGGDFKFVGLYSTNIKYRICFCIIRKQITDMYKCEFFFLISLAMQGEAFEESLRHQHFSEHMLSRKTPADIDKTKIATMQSRLDAPVRSILVDTAVKLPPGGRPRPSFEALMAFRIN